MISDPTPRIAPLARSAWTEDARDIFAMLGGPAARETGLNNNALETLAVHPGLARAFLTFNIHIMAKSSLPPRLRELVILRTVWLNRFEYDWRYHQSSGAAIGLTVDDIRSIQEGPEAKGWTDLERAALRATDQLCEVGKIDDQTWHALAHALDQQELIDLLFTVGGYTMIAWALNNMGVQLEPGMPRGFGITGAEP